MILLLFGQGIPGEAQALILTVESSQTVTLTAETPITLTLTPES